MRSMKTLTTLAVAAAVMAPLLASAAADARNTDSAPKTRAEVKQELREWQRNPVSHDGWLMMGDGMIYVGPPDQQGLSKSPQAEARPGNTEVGASRGDDASKTSAEVVQELREWQRNPVTHDGWLMVGDGMIYVGPQHE